MFYIRIILLPTLININAAIRKLKKLKSFLLSFNNVIPKKILHIPINTNINEKYFSGLRLLDIRFKDIIDKDIANTILEKLKIFFIIIKHFLNIRYVKFIGFIYEWRYMYIYFN